MVFGDQFGHKSHGLLVISKLLGACGALNFSFHAAVHLIWELPSDVWEQMEKTLGSWSEVISHLSCELLISLRQWAKSPRDNNNFWAELEKKMSNILAPSMLEHSCWDKTLCGILGKLLLSLSEVAFCGGGEKGLHSDVLWGGICLCKRCFLFFLFFLF